MRMAYAEVWRTMPWFRKKKKQAMMGWNVPLGHPYFIHLNLKFGFDYTTNIIFYKILKHKWLLKF